jgi:hypothetical protein
VGAFSEEAGAQPVKVCAADLEMTGGIRDLNQPLIELLENLQEEQVGEAIGELLF